MNKIDEIIKRVQYDIDYGIEDDGQFDSDIRKMIKVFNHINTFVTRHGTITLECGSEWLYQSGTGQEDALELIGRILDEFGDM